MTKRLGAAIGIETLSGVFTAILPRRSRLPCEKMEAFSTADDNQPEIKVRVFQGNASTVSGRRMRALGNFTVLGIPPAPRGTPKIEIVFAVASDGDFGLRARDAASGADLGIAAKDVEVAAYKTSIWERMRCVATTRPPGDHS